jgi:hypothetical protein
MRTGGAFSVDNHIDIKWLEFRRQRSDGKFKIVDRNNLAAILANQLKMTILPGCLFSWSFLALDSPERIPDNAVGGRNLQQHFALIEKLQGPPDGYSIYFFFARGHQVGMIENGWRAKDRFKDH